MAWWAWVSIGALLLVAELTIVDLDFYLIFLGVSALAVGGLELAGLHAPYWVQWLLFAFLAVSSLMLFRSRVYASLRPPPEGAVPEGVAGQRAIASAAIAPGAMGTVTLRGARWQARNVGDFEIASGAACIVEASEGLVLKVRPER
jgi:membrane protein implicated in regulation of membrane protease activity